MHHPQVESGMKTRDSEEVASSQPTSVVSTKTPAKAEHASTLLCISRCLGRVPVAPHCMMLQPSVDHADGQETGLLGQHITRLTAELRVCIQARLGSTSF